MHESKFKMILIHKRNYYLVDAHKDLGKEQYIYNESLSAFYVPSSDDRRHIWLQVPEVLATKLNLKSEWEKNEITEQNERIYFLSDTIGNAEKLLQKANDKFLEFIVPKIKKKIILFTIAPEKIDIWYEVCYLVDNNGGKYYTLESIDGNSKYHSKNMYCMGDVPEHLDWSEPAEKWFKEAHEALTKLNKQLRTMLMKPIYNNNNQLTGYGYFKSEEVKLFISTNTLPIIDNYRKFLAEKNPEPKEM